MEEVDIHPLDVFFNLERYEGETSTHLFIRMVDIFREVPSDIMPSRKELIRKFRELGISPKDPDLMLLFQILDAFWNLEKQEDESATQFFIRMFNAYQEIPSDYRPPSSALPNRMRELGLLYDHQFLNFLKLMDNELVVEENECETEVTYESNEVSDSNGDENFEHSEGESAHDDTNMPTDDSKCESEEDDSLSVEEISALLDLEYQKHIERNGPKFFPNHHGEQGDGSVHSQEVLDEGDNNSQDAYSEDDIELHTTYEHEEVLGYIADEDICLTGQEDDDSQKDEFSTLFDETSDDPDKSSHEGMVEFFIFLNPLFEEEVIEDRSEFSIFLNPLFEEDLPCSQIHQHHDEDRRPDDSFEDDEAQDMNEEVYLANEPCTSSSYEEGLFQTCKGDTKSDMCEEEIALKHGAENFQSILADQTLGDRENVLLEDELFSKPCCEEKQYLKYGADCVEEGLFQTCKGDTKSDICEEEIALKHAAENFQSILADQTLGERENVLLEDKPFSKPCCEEKQYLKYGADCVEKGIQEDVCAIDQIHDYGYLLYSKDHIAPHDLSKASMTDTKDFTDEMEPMNILYEDGAPTTSLMFRQKTEMMKGKHIMIRRKKVLHGQNRVFDRGKNQVSFFGEA